MSCEVLICIQARSTSTRLPNKGFAMIGNQTMTEHIITAAKGSAHHLGKRYDFRAEVGVALLVPHKDPLAEVYAAVCDVIEGDEEDVLSRFKLAFDKYKPKYIVRLTADCPKIPSFVITKMIDTIRAKHANYVSNVGEEWRTSADGHDCEVMDAKAFEWLYENSETKAEREHVTLALRKRKPSWLYDIACIHQVDNSDQKWSVDTPEELARMREREASFARKVKTAKMTHKALVYL